MFFSFKSYIIIIKLYIIKKTLSNNKEIKFNVYCTSFFQMSYF